MLGSKTKIREQAGKAFLEKWHLQGDLKEAREEARQILGGGGGRAAGNSRYKGPEAGVCPGNRREASVAGEEKVVRGSSEAGEAGTDCQAVVWTRGFVLWATRGHW